MVTKTPVKLVIKSYYHGFYSPRINRVLSESEALEQAVADCRGTC